MADYRYRGEEPLSLSLDPEEFSGFLRANRLEIEEVVIEAEPDAPIVIRVEVEEDDDEGEEEE